MEELQVKQLRSKGDRTTGRLMLISCAVVVLFDLCVLLLNLAVEKAYSGTAGLAGFQKRALLDTVRFVFQDIGIVLLPFWQIGVVRAAMLRSRQQPAKLRDLTFGFTRFGPVLGKALLSGLILFFVLFTAVQVSSTIFAFTPMGVAAGDTLAEYMADATDYAALMESIPVDVLLKAVAPALVLSALLGLPAVYVVSCRLRMANYIILEDEKIRAFPGLFGSVALTQGQLWNFVQLDLGFWWYYLLTGLTVALGYADLILPALGVQLDPGVLRYGAFALSCGVRLLMAWALQSRVELTYANFYETLKKNSVRMQENPSDPEE